MLITSLNETFSFSLARSIWEHWILHYKYAGGNIFWHFCLRMNTPCCLYVSVSCFIKFPVNSRAGLLLNCLDSVASCIFTEKHSSCSLHSFIKKSEVSFQMLCFGRERDGTYTQDGNNLSLWPHADIICYDFTVQFLKVCGMGHICGKRMTSILLWHRSRHVQNKWVVNEIGINRQGKYSKYFFYCFLYRTL